MKRIVQIELTAHCNRHCTYCGNPVMTRAKGYTTTAIVERTVEIAKQLGQFDKIGLNHYGESLLHPQIIDFIKIFNASEIHPFLYTNGDFLTDEMIDRLSTVYLEYVVISGHMEQEKRILLQQKCSMKGIVSYWQSTIDNDPYTTTIANQIPLAFENVSATLPILTDPMAQCGFLRNEFAIVLWNGDLVPCCFDYDGLGVFGNIMDDNAIELNPKPFKVCNTCPGHPGNP